MSAATQSASKDAYSNASIFFAGTICTATKLPVLTLGLGPVKDLKPIPGAILNDGKLITKEAPNGANYDGDSIAVVRILGGKTKMTGPDGKEYFDLYAVSPAKAEKLFKTTTDLSALSNDQVEDLKGLLSVATDLKVAYTPKEPGRKVILVTEEMVKSGIDHCFNEWDPETPCDLYEGDVFLVTDPANFAGYRIGKEEFEETHTLK